MYETDHSRTAQQILSIDGEWPVERSTTDEELASMDRTLLQATEEAKNISDLVAQITCLLVDNPAGVSIEISTGQKSTVFRLRVDNEDVGKVIGKQGRTARSLRTILSAASKKLNHHFALDILDAT
jgi:uncharacterized protein